MNYNAKENGEWKNKKLTWCGETRSKTMVMACSGQRFSFSSLSVCLSVCSWVFLFSLVFLRFLLFSGKSLLPCSSSCLRPLCTSGFFSSVYVLFTPTLPVFFSLIVYIETMPFLGWERPFAMWSFRFWYFVMKPWITFNWTPAFSPLVRTSP